MRKTLVGIKRFASKQGKPYVIINITADYSPAQIQNGCVGKRVEEVFLPDDLHGVLKDSDIGKDIVIDYDVVGNRSYVIGVAVVK